MDEQSRLKRVSRRELLRGAAVAAGWVTAGLAGLLPRRTYAADPVWTTVPDQTWTVGVPVNFDLANYVSDADMDLLLFSLDRALPPGLTLSGSVISGTPTAVFASTAFVASASDVNGPAAPTNLRAS